MKTFYRSTAPEVDTYVGIYIPNLPICLRQEPKPGAKYCTDVRVIYGDEVKDFTFEEFYRVLGFTEKAE